jgi:hypothetical protein
LRRRTRNLRYEQVDVRYNCLASNKFHIGHRLIKRLKDSTTAFVRPSDLVVFTRPCWLLQQACGIQDRDPIPVKQFQHNHLPHRLPRRKRNIARESRAEPIIVTTTAFYHSSSSDSTTCKVSAQVQVPIKLSNTPRFAFALS